ncbi:MAG: hypothetical protein WBD99_02520 [Thermodesulfobacteriota bacterium]
MGYFKNEQLRKDYNWMKLCESRGWICDICGEHPEVRGDAPAFLPWICDHCLAKFEMEPSEVQQIMRYERKTS